jgi:hypothetical protein
MLPCRGKIGSDQARFLRGIALAGKRRRYPKASSIPAAVARPIVGIQWVRATDQQDRYAAMPLIVTT